MNNSAIVDNSDGVAARAVALKASLKNSDTLAAAESAMLREWLDRLSGIRKCDRQR
jgi:hypothetical protein